MSKLKTSIIAIVTAASVALGAVAPAAAMTEQEKNTLALILGAVAAGVVVDKVIKDNKKSNQRKAGNGQPYWSGNGYYGDDDYYDNDHGWPGDRWNNRRPVIPAQCVFPIRRGDERREAVSPRCLNEVGFNQRLPRDCAFEARIRGDRRTVYGARCLEKKGFRIGSYR